jgi:transposase InsO family protein
VIAVDFFTVDTVWLQRLSVRFFIELASRRMHVSGCTAHPDPEWVTQQARQVTWTLSARSQPVRFLIRDRDRKFTASFDAVFQAQGARMIQTPVRTPQANGVAERFVRTVRSEWKKARSTERLRQINPTRWRLMAYCSVPFVRMEP